MSLHVATELGDVFHLCQKDPCASCIFLVFLASWGFQRQGSWAGLSVGGDLTSCFRGSRFKVSGKKQNGSYGIAVTLLTRKGPATKSKQQASNLRNVSINRDGLRTARTYVYIYTHAYVCIYTHNHSYSDSIHICICTQICIYSFTYNSHIDMYMYTYISAPQQAAWHPIPALDSVCDAHAVLSLGQTPRHQPCQAYLTYMNQGQNSL